MLEVKHCLAGAIMIKKQLAGNDKKEVQKLHNPDTNRD
jgi:hypothetical protein